MYLLYLRLHLDSDYFIVKSNDIKFKYFKKSYKVVTSGFFSPDFYIEKNLRGKVYVKHISITFYKLDSPKPKWELKNL